MRGMLQHHLDWGLPLLDVQVQRAGFSIAEPTAVWARVALLGVAPVTEMV